jgi:hypothetical protein
MKALTKLQIERALKDETFDPLDESISADEWQRKRNAQLSGQPEMPPNSSALLWLEVDEEFALDLQKLWKERIEAPAMDTMLALINLGDSPEDLQGFREALPIYYDIARETNEKLLMLRDELRVFWNEVSKETGPSARVFGNNEKVALALHNWWKAYDLASDGWKIFWSSGDFYPTQKNFRGIVARALLSRRRYLLICLNPDCKRYFIGRKTDAKYCGDKKCGAFANNFRQQKFQKDKKRRKQRG